MEPIIIYCRLLVIILFILPGMSACDHRTYTDNEPLSLIPGPVSIKTSRGHFTLAPGTRILVSPGTTESEAIGQYLAEELFLQTMLQLKVLVAGDTENVSGAIILSLAEGSNANGKEGYRLTIHNDNAEISADAPAGLFYGTQTFLQLIPDSLQKGKKIRLPNLVIHDKPAFAWRGMHLDVSRHFFPVEFIKEYIDILAMHKMNVFHWHLVDDQGWRIEIKKYPRLTEKAAWREGTGTEPWDYFIGPAVEGKPKYGGFYTQDEIREIVAYATSRYVTIVPEIEMPGHERAALDAYPEMYCSGRPFIRNESLPWEFTDPFCAGNEKTFTFLEDILSEVIELFPSEYIHIGGDEAKKTPWEKCSKCRARMQSEGLDNVEELQSYFIRRIGKFLESKNKRMVGWDEIMEGGLAPGAIVMSWRGEDGGIEAAQHGHDVVMTPSRILYFSSPNLSGSAGTAARGTDLLKEVYDYKPVPDILANTEAVHVLGAQSCLWTENIQTQEQAEYQILPRLCALAEVLWIPDSLKDWNDFQKRMTGHYDRLDRRNINYFISPPGGIRPENIFISEQAIELQVDLPEAEIRYTLDGSDPVAGSDLYTGPVTISENTVIKARTFMKSGRSSQVTEGSFQQEDPRPAIEEDTSGMQQGIRLNCYEGNISSLDEFAKLKPSGSYVVQDLSMPVEHPVDFFGLEYIGYIKIPAEGVYTFVTISDDGSRLYLADELVADNDGVHVARPAEGHVALSAGYHPMKIIYFDNQYGESLEVRITGPGFEEPGFSGRLFHK